MNTADQNPTTPLHDQKARLAAAALTAYEAYRRALGAGASLESEDVEADMAAFVASIYHAADVMQLDTHEVAEAAWRNYGQETFEARREQREQRLDGPVTLEEVERIANTMPQPGHLVVSLRPGEVGASSIQIECASGPSRLHVIEPSGSMMSFTADGRPLDVLNTLTPRHLEAGRRVEHFAAGDTADVEQHREGHIVTVNRAVPIPFLVDHGPQVVELGERVEIMALCVSNYEPSRIDDRDPNLDMDRDGILGVLIDRPDRPVIRVPFASVSWRMDDPRRPANWGTEFAAEVVEVKVGEFVWAELRVTANTGQEYQVIFYEAEIARTLDEYQRSKALIFISGIETGDEDGSRAADQGLYPEQIVDSAWAALCAHLGEQQA
jgi:hypothetical protein